MVKEYGDIETALLNLIADYLQKGDIQSVDEIYQWQAEHITKTDEVARLAVMIAETFKLQNLKDTKKLLEESGKQIDEDVRSELQELTSKSVKGDSSDIIQDNISTVSQQIETGMMNLINRNVASNAVADIYKSITNQCVSDVVSGNKTLERAIDDNIYQQVASGIPTGLVNKRGAVLSLEGYSRLCIQTAVNRSFEKIRMNAMSDYDVTLGLYSIHPASRRACAPIQHKVVNLVPPESPGYNDKYDSIYNHGYGEPAGARGINCKHYITPFIDGVSIIPKNPFPDLTPGQAIKNGKIQAKQRNYERAIRQAKKQLAMAKRLKDEQGIAHYRSLIRGRQSRLRQLISEHDFLFRDYQREQIRAVPSGLSGNDKLTPSQKHVKMKITNGEWGTKINNEKQAPHMESTHIEGKSYLYDNVDPQELLDKYSGKGELQTNVRGVLTNKEIVKTDNVIGKDVKLNQETKWIKIHHSKKRTHIVPFIPKENKK